MGFNIPNGDPNVLAEKLNMLYLDKNMREKMGNNARLCAMECFDRDSTYLLFESIIIGN